VYREHVPAGGHRLRDGIAFEIYSSGDHADPDSMRTELCTPIEEAGRPSRESRT